MATPQTVAAQAPRIECMFPADEATETHHAEMMANAGNPYHATAGFADEPPVAQATGAAAAGADFAVSLRTIGATLVP